MNIEVLETGSSGNCTVVDDIIAIDMGVPFKRIKPYIKSLKLVLLTHVHS